ncbi:MAG: hypothetical protein M3Q49_00890 [Actinomycetota bacterium]|nr:hypothetical protein [Actinomycetota bacterium]
MRTHENDGDLICAYRAFDRARTGDVSFAAALEEALRQIEPGVLAGKIERPRFLEGGFVERLARRMEITEDQARVLLGLAVHGGLLSWDEKVVLENAVEQCASRMDMYRFYAQATPDVERGDVYAASPESREPSPGRQKGLKKPPELPEKAEDMGNLVSRYAARRANREPYVMQFRHSVLGGCLLNPGELEGASRSGPLSATAALERARAVGENLAKAYGWEQEEAEHFLLTGKVPGLTPFAVNVTRKGSAEGARTEITVVALPGTPARYVTAAYRWEQRKLLGRKDSRPLSEAGLKLYGFVVEEETRAMAEGREPSNRELMDEWNRRHEDHPDYVYVDPRRFGRAVRRAEEVARRHSGTQSSKEPAPKQE